MLLSLAKPLFTYVFRWDSDDYSDCDFILGFSSEFVLNAKIYFFFLFSGIISFFIAMKIEKTKSESIIQKIFIYVLSVIMVIAFLFTLLMAAKAMPITLIIALFVFISFVIYFKYLKDE